MDERQWMELAVDEARKSKDESDGRIHPRVGVVVVKDGQVLAVAHRGEQGPGEHAEFTALDKKLKDDDVAGATAYCTLEPCTSRSHRKTPCAQRLVDRKISRVVIGMLDPNKDIRGRGEWYLAEHNVEIGRFDSDLMKALMDLNRDFTRSQQRLGLKITFPADGAEWRKKICPLKGTFVNRPGDDVVAITNVGTEWWPQLAPVRILEDASNEWEVNVDFGICCPVRVFIVRADELGMQLIQFYRKLVYQRNQVITNVAQHFKVDVEQARLVVAPLFWSLSMARLAKGLEMEDCISLNVTNING